VCLRAQALFEPAAFQVGAWWQHPATELARFGNEVFGQGSGAAVWRGLLLTAALSVVWSLVGGWITRSELVRLRPLGTPVQVSPTRFVREKARSLCMPFPMALIMVSSCLLPGAFAGLVNRLLVPGVGAVLVAVVLPALLLCSLVVVVLLFGCLAYAMIPTT